MSATPAAIRSASPMRRYVRSHSTSFGAFPAASPSTQPIATSVSSPTVNMTNGTQAAPRPASLAHAALLNLTRTPGSHTSIGRSPLAAQSAANETNAGPEIIADLLVGFYDKYKAFYVARMLNALDTDDVVESMSNAELESIELATRFDVHKERVWLIGIYLRTTKPLNSDVLDEEMFEQYDRYIGHVSIYVDTDALYIASSAICMQWTRNMTYVAVKEEVISATRMWYMEQSDHTRTLHDSLPATKKHLLDLDRRTQFAKFQDLRQKMSEDIALERQHQTAAQAAAAANAVVSSSSSSSSSTRPVRPPRPPFLFTKAPEETPPPAEETVTTTTTTTWTRVPPNWDTVSPRSSPTAVSPRIGQATANPHGKNTSLLASISPRFRSRTQQ